MRILVATLALALSACASNFLLQPTGHATIERGVYTNSTYDIQFRFAKPGCS